jgi:RecJ-like exonuclease
VETDRKLEDKAAVWRRRSEYEAAVELVRVLRSMGVVMRVKCPRCGGEGSVSTLMSNGRYYVVVRHDKSTHTVPKPNIGEVLQKLCEVKKELVRVLELYKKYEEGGIKFCADLRRPGA